MSKVLGVPLKTTHCHVGEEGVNGIFDGGFPELFTSKLPGPLYKVRYKFISGSKMSIHAKLGGQRIDLVQIFLGLILKNGQLLSVSMEVPQWFIEYQGHLDLPPDRNTLTLETFYLHHYVYTFFFHS